MPTLDCKDFKVNFLLRNKHFNTLYTSFFRKVEGVYYIRKWFDTPDLDQFAVDCCLQNSKKAAIVVHGLESSTQRAYVKGAVKALHSSKIDVYALNLRSCSGEMNLTFQSYYSGQTTDIHQLVEYLVGLAKYDQLYLVGYSLGGNIVLRYLGEQAHNLSPIVKASVTFSVPCDLRSTAHLMANFSNFLYMKSFVKTIKQKLYIRMKKFPEKGLIKAKIKALRTFEDIDNLYTAPAHGFKNAEDYWANCSSKPLFQQITIPSLLINAQNDPFLSPECQSHEAAYKNPNFYFASPRFGGHVGFASNLKLNGIFWHERMMLDFFAKQANIRPEKLIYKYINKSVL